jgi:hypothetical protein
VFHSVMQRRLSKLIESIDGIFPSQEFIDAREITILCRKIQLHFLKI